MEILNPELYLPSNRRNLTQLFTKRIEQVNFYEAKKGSVLGDHYHKKTTEIFFIVKGSIILHTHFNKSRVSHSEVVNKNTCFRINPQEVHIIECLTDCNFLTFLTHPFDNKNPDLHKEEK